jgi:signal recognition particle receptor subunit beta
MQRMCVHLLTAKALTNSQTKSLPTATSELHALLGLPSLQSVPLLVLANKNDLPGAIGVDDLIKEMRLGEIGGRVVSVRCIWALLMNLLGKMS